MDFIHDFPKLEAPQQERFQQVVTRLLSGEVLTPGSPLNPDRDWRFAERFRELIDSYLRYGGWRLDIDLGLRLARAVHETGAQRVRFSKLESLIICALRLHYHEQMQAAQEEERCEISAGALRERLVAAGKPAAQLSPRAMAAALRRLARHSLASIPRGFEGQDQEIIAVTPLIEKVLPPDRIQDLEQRVRAYLASRSPPPGEAAPEPADETAEAEGEDGEA
ncbi:MAG: DUF4194 domain-containing protein [Deltaproteobacteria bacterium]|nr:DUF4194 domain-containing protein [Deltaproteobacteria bacterium]